jgi:ABC-type amino acid transport substrate-binding protein
VKAIAGVVCLLTLASVAGLAARADEPKRLGVGIFAPSAPFDGPEARLDFVTELAEHLAARTGRPVVGRVFARASDLAAAIKKGEITFVVVDAPNAGALGFAPDVLGLAVRGNATSVAWELVAGDAVHDAHDLRGKSVSVPIASGRESAFLHATLFEGELAASYLARVAAAPDALSAIAAVSVGRADAATVPGGLALPAGVHRVLTLRDLPWPAFAAAPGVDDATRRAFLAALASFRSNGAFARFDTSVPTTAFVVSFSTPSRRGPLAVPAGARLDVKGVLGTRHFVIDRVDLAPLVEAPGGKK